MSTLLYAVVSSCRDACTDWERIVVPPGVDGHPVRLVDADGLGAAVSTVNATDVAPTVERALAYAAVVETLHTGLATIPMRYGCVFRGERDLLDSLTTQRQKYVDLLNDVGGCVEMSVQLLVGEAARDEASAAGCDAVGAVRPAGTAYLRSRRLRYEQQARPLEDARRRLDVVRTQLSRFCVKCKVEWPPGEPMGVRARLLTAHFLVARELVADCRAAFLSLHESRDLVLTGPWPPFNFVG